MIGSRQTPEQQEEIAKLFAAYRARQEEFWRAPLLTRPGGKPWRRSNQAYPFRRVASACGQDPAEVTMYALRHSSIVRQLLAGVPVRVVAAGHDTSVAMIERNYSRYITDHADALVRGAMLDLMPRDKPKLAVIG